MRQVTAVCALAIFLLSIAEPAMAAPKKGVPGRRLGGGTRWSGPRIKQAVSLRGKLSAMAFASRTRLPMEVRVKALYS